MKKLKIKEKYLLLDDEDFEWVSKMKWNLNRGYVRSRGKQIGRYVLEKSGVKIPKKKYVDHINRNKLDNRKINLRLATRSENQANSFSPKNTSGFKGVIKVRNRRGEHTNWKATITRNQKKIYLGVFKTPEEAHEAYKEKAREIFGEFARLTP